MPPSSRPRLTDEELEPRDDPFPAPADPVLPAAGLQPVGPPQPDHTDFDRPPIDGA